MYKAFTMTLLNALKTVLLLTIALYIAPFLIENIKTQYSYLLEPQAHIGILSLTQPLYSSDYLTEDVCSFFKDPVIQAIVIKIDCADIAAGTSQTIFHDIRQLKKEYPKPIIALVENVCLSGAYLIASSCDYIVAPESAIIGNIGPSFCNASIKKIVETTKNSNTQEITDLIDNESYQQLAKQVALSRKLSLTTISNWADGKIFTATQAITLGLINEIGSLCTVIKTIKEKALIEGEIKWVEPKEKQQNLCNIFFGNKCTIS